MERIWSRNWWQNSDREITRLQLKIEGNYVTNNKIKRFILVTHNASFHVSEKTKQFIETQIDWLTVIFLPKRSPNLNPVETGVNRNLKKDV